MFSSSNLRVRQLLLEAFIKGHLIARWREADLCHASGEVGFELLDEVQFGWIGDKILRLAWIVLQSLLARQQARSLRTSFTQLLPWMLGSIFREGEVLLGIKQ